MTSHTPVQSTPPNPRFWPLLLIDAALAIGYMALIFYVSSAPSLVPLQLHHFQLDKVAHLCAFGLCSVLLCRVVFRATGSLYWAVLIGITISGLYGISDEIHQSFVPGRHADIYDVYADICGAFVGAMLWLWVMRR